MVTTEDTGNMTDDSDGCCLLTAWCVRGTLTEQLIHKMHNPTWCWKSSISTLQVGKLAQESWGNGLERHDRAVLSFWECIYRYINFAYFLLMSWFFKSQILNVLKEEFSIPFSEVNAHLHASFEWGKGWFTLKAFWTDSPLLICKSGEVTHVSKHSHSLLWSFAGGGKSMLQATKNMCRSRG